MRRRDALLAVAMLVVAVGLIVARAGSGGARSAATAAASSPSAPASTLDPFAAFSLTAAPLDWSRPLPGAAVAPAGYVGSAACAKCHADVARRYASRPMANTGMHRIAGRTAALDAIFDGKHVVQHAASGFSYRPLHDDRGYFVEERLDAPDGRPIHLRREPITLSFTAGTSGAAFGFERGGRLHQVPIDWYVGSATWGIDPGYVQNGRFSRPFGVTCIGCHTEYPTHVPSNEAIVRGPLAEGIGCERCHGPGAKHATTMNGDDVVNPARLPFARQLDVCAQCHLEGAAEVLRAGKGHYDFVAGTALSSQQVQWVEETPKADAFALVGATDRLVRSACFTKSPGKLGCTTCHDAHGAPAAKPMRDACVGCHASPGSKPCGLPESDRLARNHDDCASCHMARDTPADFRQRVPGVRLEAVDHWIRTRPQAPRPLDEPPVAQQVAKIVPFLRLVGEVAPPGMAVDELAANEAVAWMSSGLEGEAAPKLLTFAASPPQIPALYRAIGDAYAKALEAPTAAPGADADHRHLVERLRAARATELSLAFDDVDALVRYAQACMLVGGNLALREAESALRRALGIASEDASALVELGGLLFRTGRAD
ncbi:MAG: hypothetical protein ABI175_22190, partial [Polyangiales bacterium]